MTEQQQLANNQAIQAISSFLYGLLKDSPDIEGDKAFYAAKEKFNGMPGVNKEKFSDIFEASKEQFSKPLVRANIDLAQLEQLLRLRVSNALHEIAPTGPDHTRELISLVRAVRTSDAGPMVQQAMAQALPLLDPDTAAEVCECWPSLREDFNAE